jgi:hypothetical protein
MLRRSDQNLLSEAYGQVGLGDVSAPSLMGKPVMITMDMPGAEVADEHEHDHEHHGDHECDDDSVVDMAAAELHRLSEYSQKLQELVSQMPSIEGWVASKITKASSYISDVYHYLEYEESENEGSDRYNAGYEDSCSCEYAEKGCMCGGCEECQ